MADVEISYNNETIASLSSSGTEILDTAETFMADDITISYTKPSAPIIQALNVTANGTYTPPTGVNGYAPVTVNVSGGGGGTIKTLTGTDFSSFTATNWTMGDFALDLDVPKTCMLKLETSLGAFFLTSVADTGLYEITFTSGDYASYCAEGCLLVLHFSSAASPSPTVTFSQCAYYSYGELSYDFLAEGDIISWEFILFS